MNFIALIGRLGKWNHVECHTFVVGWAESPYFSEQDFELLSSTVKPEI
jgi:hypothetical protein